METNQGYDYNGLPVTNTYLFYLKHFAIALLFISFGLLFIHNEIARITVFFSLFFQIICWTQPFYSYADKSTIWNNEKGKDMKLYYKGLRAKYRK